MSVSLWNMMFLYTGNVLAHCLFVGVEVRGCGSKRQTMRGIFAKAVARHQHSLQWRDLLLTSVRHPVSVSLAGTSKSYKSVDKIVLAQSLAEKDLKSGLRDALCLSKSRRCVSPSYDLELFRESQIHFLMLLPSCQAGCTQVHPLL